MNQPDYTNHANPSPRTGFDFRSLVVGILYIIVGIIAFRDPIDGVGIVAYLFAFSAIYRGVSYLFGYYVDRKRNGTGETMFLILGIIDIIAGLILVINIRASILALPILFAIWFIASSVMMLFSAGRLREHNNTRYMVVIFLSILGIIAGLMSLSNPLSSVLTIAMFVSLYFITSGISHIVQAF